MASSKKVCIYWSIDTGNRGHSPFQKKWHPARNSLCPYMGHSSPMSYTHTFELLNPVFWSTKATISPTQCWSIFSTHKSPTAPQFIPTPSSWELQDIFDLVSSFLLKKKQAGLPASGKPFVNYCFCESSFTDGPAVSWRRSQYHIIYQQLLYNLLYLGQGFFYQGWNSEVSLFHFGNSEEYRSFNFSSVHLVEMKPKSAVAPIQCTLLFQLPL